MKAVVLHRPGLLKVENREKPRSQRGEVLVRVGVTLTCGTDLKTYKRGHSLVKMPIILGHEFAGIVEEVGDGVERLKPGDRVVAANSAPCGVCFYCRKSAENLCEKLDEVLLGFTWPGAYAEYVVIPKRIVERNTYVIPPHISFEEAAILEPLACVVHGNEAAGITLGDSVAIIGAGPIGLLHLELARLNGAGRIIVFDKAEGRLKIARELGADHVMNVTEEDGIGEVKALTEQRGVDVVIESVGIVETWSTAIKMARKGGTVVLFGGCPSGTNITFDTKSLHYDELTLKGVFHHTPKTVARAFSLITLKKINIESLITDTTKLDGVPQALESMAQGKNIKVAIKIS